MLRRFFYPVSLVVYVLIFSSQLMAEQASTSPNPLTLAPAQGKVLLTVTGKIEHTNHLNRAEFDQQLLESLEQHEVVTQNPWFIGKNRYYGPLGRALIKAVGAEEATCMKISSINGFIAEAPISDFFEYNVIFALKKNGQYQRIRDRGPIFTVYPFDQHPHLNTEMHYNRSVWQVKNIEFY